MHTYLKVDGFTEVAMHCGIDSSVMEPLFLPLQPLLALYRVSTKAGSNSTTASCLRETLKGRQVASIDVLACFLLNTMVSTPMWLTVY